MNAISEKRRALYRLAGRPASVYENHIIVDICTACGADCVYCLHQAAGLATPRLMPRATFMTLVEILEREEYELVYLYQSGEPLLHPNYTEFLSAVAERGMNSSTATKVFSKIDFGQLDVALARCDATGRKAEFLITVDALSQDAQDRIGPGIRSEVVKKNLAGMARLNHAHSSMKCVLDTVVNAYNEKDLDAIAAYMKELGFTTWFPKRMGYFMPTLARPQDLEAIAKAVPTSTEHAARFSIINGGLVAYEEQHACDLGPAVINPEGDVTVCCHDMLHKNRLGNVIQANSVRDVLAAPAFQAAAARGRVMGLPICQGCN